MLGNTRKMTYYRVLKISKYSRVVSIKFKYTLSSLNTTNDTTEADTTLH